MSPFLPVKPGNALDRQVVGFGCSRGENNVFGVGTYEIGDVLSKNGPAKNSCYEDGRLNVPSWLPQQLCQLPNRRRESDCAGFRIGPSSTEASRRALGGLQVLLPKRNRVRGGRFGQKLSNLHIQIDRSGLVLQGSLSARDLELEAKHV